MSAPDILSTTIPRIEDCDRRILRLQAQFPIVPADDPDDWFTYVLTYNGCAFLHAQGCDDSLIAFVIGVHEMDVYDCRVRQGLAAHPRFSPPVVPVTCRQAQACAGLYATGYTDYQIARELALPWQAVTTWRDQLAWPSRELRLQIPGPPPLPEAGDDAPS